MWHALAPRSHELIVARWPQPDARAIDPDAAAEIEWLIRLVGEVRSSRTELNVPPGARLPFAVDGAGAATAARLERNAGIIARLARIEPGTVSGGTAQVVVEEGPVGGPRSAVRRWACTGRGRWRPAGGPGGLLGGRGWAGARGGAGGRGWAAARAAPACGRATAGLCAAGARGLARCWGLL